MRKITGKNYDKAGEKRMVNKKNKKILENLRWKKW